MVPTAQAPLPALLRVLAEPIRLRILALLELEELSVGELGRALGLAQSRVSNHLRVLREAGLLVERHAGKSTHLRSALVGRPEAGAGTAARLWGSLRPALEELPEHAADRLRLSDLLAGRRAGSPAFFDALAGEWHKVGELFGTGAARERAAASLLPPGLVLADLGCGTGYVARALLGLAERLICVDRSPGMLETARQRLEPGAAGTRVEYRLGELDALPVADGELDGAVAAMVLHHLPTPDGALAEMRRALRPGGTAVVLELAPHGEQWMHAALGDRHLGLDPAHVVAAVRRAGFEAVRLEQVADRYRPHPPEGAGPAPSLALYIVRGRAPSSGAARPSP